MNIALILSGGVGARFGAQIPKQYHTIDGKPVIDYVIEACLNASRCDRTVVVCDPGCVQYSTLLQSDLVDKAVNGADRYASLKSGLDFIRAHYDCDKVCIFDAVAPLVYPALIDEYFDRLDTYDCVITCQKITGELGNYNFDILKREDYYIMQSPESFRFPLLIRHFDPAFDSSELSNQLPKDAKRYLNFSFRRNYKITYDFELEYVGEMIRRSALSEKSAPAE